MVASIIEKLQAVFCAILSGPDLRNETGKTELIYLKGCSLAIH